MQNAKLKESSDIRERTFEFATRIVRLCRYLDRKLGSSRTLSKQLLRSGTSIGANVEEAQAGHSRADFIYKLEIALKEARETLFWLRLLAAAEIVDLSRIQPLQAEAGELRNVLGAIVVSAKENLSRSAAAGRGRS